MPAQIELQTLVVRPIQPEEETRWDRLMLQGLAIVQQAGSVWDKPVAMGAKPGSTIITGCRKRYMCISCIETQGSGCPLLFSRLN